MEIFYYECIFDVLHNNSPHGEKLVVLNRFKAKIVQLHNARLQRVMLDNNKTDRIEGERPPLFRILQMQKRRTARTIQTVLDEHGCTQWSRKGIVQAFTTYLRRKYEPVVVDEECVAAMAEAGRPARPTK